MDEAERGPAAGGRAMTGIPYDFYLPEDPRYTVVDSALDSIRYLLKISRRDDAGRLFCPSVDGDVHGEAIRYRGRLMEGTGYCADSIFGARMLVRAGRVLGSPELERHGFSYLDHALDAGFFDDDAVPVFLYRDIENGALLHNLEARPEYVELGHVARVGAQLLALSRLDPDPARAARCRAIAARTAEWALSVERCANGWLPRRVAPDGSVYTLAPDAFGPTDLPTISRPDPIADRSGAGVLVLELAANALGEGIIDARPQLRRDADAFVAAGGHFGSTNTDTEDLAENVSYALAFQALLAVADVLDDPELERFAYAACLSPLAGFELRQDVNGVATKGLLYMEDSWNAACTWEMAEAAQAYLLAYSRSPRLTYLTKGLTILRGMAKHHYGDWGFLTEAVDWDGHSTSSRHFAGERYGAIATTHPFLNNLHVLQPTVFLLEEIAVRAEVDGRSAFFDNEGNRLCELPVPPLAWGDV